jgi:hydroxymethylbilane synthase
LEREDPRDCLVIKANSPHRSLKDLPEGAVVGTSSVRRVAQLRRAYPKLLFADVVRCACPRQFPSLIAKQRGNINTRLSKLDAPDGPFAALILAAAGLNRLNFNHRISEYLEAPDLYYAVGQGALGIEIRSKDPRIRDLIAQIDHWQTSWTCQAERELLRSLEGGCSVPVGANSTLRDVQELPDGSRTATYTLSAIIASLSGERWIESTITRTVTSMDEILAVGADVAELLVQKGGKEILAELCVSLARPYLK